MSVRKYSYLFPLIVFVTLLFFSSTINQASSSLQGKLSSAEQSIMDKIEAGPGVDDPEFKRQRLAVKVYSEYAKLKEFFDSNHPKLGKEMAKILGKKAILKVGSVIYRKNKIKEFWEDMRKEGYIRVEFDLKWAFIVFEEKLTEEMEDYDHIAYEYFTFKLFKEQAGKILKNQDGKGGRSCRHIHGCDCRTR